MINNAEMTFTWLLSYLVGTFVTILVFLYLLKTRPKPYLPSWLLYFSFLHVAYWMALLSSVFNVEWALGLFSILIIVAGYTFWVAVRRFLDAKTQKRYHLIPLFMVIGLTFLTTYNATLNLPDILPEMVLHVFSGIFYGIAGFEVLKSSNRYERFVSIIFFAFSILIVSFPLIIRLDIPDFYALAGLTLSGFLFTVSALFMVLVRSIEEDIAKRAKLFVLSHTDPLTGLYNRRYLNTAKNSLDTEANLPLTIMMADLNHLKAANDRGGHLLVDGLLIAFAKLLRNWLAANATIIRFGGDEFLVIIPNTPEDKAKQYKEQLKHVAQHKTVGNFSLDVSIGYAVKVDMETPFEDIFQQADDAMYQDKPHKNTRD